MNNSTQLRHDIEAELDWDARFDSLQIGFAVTNGNVAMPAELITLVVRDGWITLDGQVSMWFQKNAAKMALHSLRGVKGISNWARSHPGTNLLQTAVP